jgi:hypothetical protein
MRPAAGKFTLGSRRALSPVKDAVMAKIIGFYVPTSLQKRVAPQSDSRKGKLIEFCASGKKPA